MVRRGTGAGETEDGIGGTEDGVGGTEDRVGGTEDGVGETEDGVGGTEFGVFSGVLEGVAFSLERGFGGLKDGRRIPRFLRMEGEFLGRCLTEGFEFPEIFQGSLNLRNFVSKVVRPNPKDHSDTSKDHDRRNHHTR